MKTKAFLLLKKGDPKNAFKLEEMNLSILKKDEVLIENEAFGLNYADVMARRGLYREAPPMPCVLGYETVGRIISVGAESNQLLIGKRVVAFSRFGGYAKHTITHIDAIAEIGEMNTNTALALATQGVTAYYMANYVSPIRQNETVLIHAAAGGVGTILIQMAKQAKATVIAKVSSEKKKEKCLELGADFAVNYTEEDYGAFIESKIGVNSLDVSFNPVGGTTFKVDRKLLGAGSRLFLFGGSELATGKLGIFSQLNFLRKMGVQVPVFLMMQSKSLIGVNMLKIADNKPKVLNHCLLEVVKLYQSGKLTIENGGEFNHSKLAEAHELMESGKSIGKISVHW